MNQAVAGEVLEREFEASPDGMGALAMLNKSEIDTQIATARRFPRSVTKFVAEATSLVALSEAVAEECIYALPRDGKTIEGPSARFAEIMAYSWGNCRSAARVIDDQGEFVTAQGVHWDLEKNTAIGYEVKRRIVDKHGRRFKPDMIGVTANAACSIALRNAILKGIPKALWNPMYDTARKTIMGDFQTLANRRAIVLQNFQKFGVAPERLFEKLGIKGEEDITLEHIVTTKGMLTALRDGDSTPEEMFPAAPQQSAKSPASAFAAAAAGATTAGASKPAESGSTTPTAKEKGTVQIRDNFLKKMGECMDSEVLALVADESNGYDWAPEDKDTLNKTYHARVEVLKRTVSEHGKHLDNLDSLEAVTLYGESLPDTVRSDDEFKKAVAARLKVINKKK